MDVVSWFLCVFFWIPAVVALSSGFWCSFLTVCFGCVIQCGSLRLMLYLGFYVLSGYSCGGRFE